MATTTAIIDDHESVREGVASAFVRAGFIVLGVAETVDEHVSRASAGGALELVPDVVVLDLSLGDSSNAGENVDRIHASGSRIVIHSIANRPEEIRESLAHGVAGVVEKSRSLDELIEAVRVVAAGGELNNLVWAGAVESDEQFVSARLSPQELRTLRLYAMGVPMEAVAAELKISYSTVATYIRRIRNRYAYVGRPAMSRYQLHQRAVEDGIIARPS